MPPHDETHEAYYNHEGTGVEGQPGHPARTIAGGEIRAGDVITIEDVG
jgi:MOSC domain-containing protein YiiM